MRVLDEGLSQLLVLRCRSDVFDRQSTIGWLGNRRRLMDYEGRGTLSFISQLRELRDFFFLGNSNLTLWFDYIFIKKQIQKSYNCQTNFQCYMQLLIDQNSFNKQIKIMQPRYDMASIQSKLYSKYSSSQTYFYTKKISDIVKQKRTVYNITYEDVQCYAQDDEYLKRFYLKEENERKMFTFKEYYFYHEDCPRIFIRNIQLIYEKWQDKKRDLVYKKLKFLYNQSYSSEESSDKSNDQDLPPVSHFLLNISEFNPYSKKYYLRVQARKEKEENQRKKQFQKLKTKQQLSGLNHQLSFMLADMSSISVISTLQEKEKSYLFENKEPKIISTKETKSKSKQFIPSIPNNPIKLNFKKNKQVPSLQIKNTRGVKLFEKKDYQKIASTERNSNISPKMGVVKEKFDGLESLKTKSIFSISSFGMNNPKSLQRNDSRQKKFDLNLNTNKKHSKNSITKPSNYESEKVIKIKDYGQSSKSTEKLRSQFGKLPGKQSSLKQLYFNADTFSDRKIQVKDLKSQTKLSQKIRSSGSIYGTTAASKKNSFKIRESYNGKK